jgi:hypothetical protein
VFIEKIGVYKDSGLEWVFLKLEDFPGCTLARISFKNNFDHRGIVEYPVIKNTMNKNVWLDWGYRIELNALDIDSVELEFEDGFCKRFETLEFLSVGGVLEILQKDTTVLEFKNIPPYSKVYIKLEGGDGIFPFEEKTPKYTVRKDNFILAQYIF